MPTRVCFVSQAEAERQLSLLNQLKSHVLLAATSCDAASSAGSCPPPPPQQQQQPQQPYQQPDHLPQCAGVFASAPPLPGGCAHCFCSPHQEEDVMRTSASLVASDSCCLLGLGMMPPYWDGADGDSSDLDMLIDAPHASG